MRVQKVFDYMKGLDVGDAFVKVGTGFIGVMVSIVLYFGVKVDRKLDDYAKLTDDQEIRIRLQAKDIASLQTLTLENKEEIQDNSEKIEEVKGLLQLMDNELTFRRRNE